VLHICKGYKPLSIYKNIWFQRLMLRQCLHVLFPFQSFLVEEMFLAMVKKTMDHHVLSNLAFVTVVSISFHL
jgi:hypothetical protein